MDKDYEDFVGRMGSFEDVIDIEETELDDGLESSGEIITNAILNLIGNTIIL